MSDPRSMVEALERLKPPAEGEDERFSGYGVMAAPFRSGHLLALRRFPASSVGPAYSSVWHRDPDGRWTFYTDVDPRQSCSRYFGSAIAAVEVHVIEIAWPSPHRFRVAVGGDLLRWNVTLAATPATRLLNVVSGLLPERLWRTPAVLSAIAAVAAPLLRAGELRLHGRTPNGQRFIANPRLVWSISASTATLRGRDLGPAGSFPGQARLGDFWLPRRGLFAIGGARMEPFDARRHRAVLSRAGPGERPPSWSG